MPDHAVRTVAELHRHARLPLGPARLPPGLLPKRLRGGLRQSVRRRRPGRVLRVLPRLRGKVRYLRPKLRHLLINSRQPRLQPRDPGLPLSQQIPQPRVGGTQSAASSGTPAAPDTPRRLPQPAPGLQIDRRQPRRQKWPERTYLVTTPWNYLDHPFPRRPRSGEL